MFDLLTEIYYAATDHIEMTYEWKQNIDKAAGAYDALLSQLTPGARELYEAWEQAQGDVNRLETQMMFFRGVRLGLALGGLS